LNDPEENTVVIKLEGLFSSIKVLAFLVDLIEDLLSKYYNSIAVSNIAKMVNFLTVTNTEASNFNSQFDVRVKLWNVGLFSEKMALPGLIEVEARTIAAILSIRFKMHFTPKKD